MFWAEIEFSCNGWSRVANIMLGTLNKHSIRIVLDEIQFPSRLLSLLLMNLYPHTGCSISFLYKWEYILLNLPLSVSLEKKKISTGICGYSYVSDIVFGADRYKHWVCLKSTRLSITFTLMDEEKKSLKKLNHLPIPSQLISDKFEIWT